MERFEVDLYVLGLRDIYSKRVSRRLLVGAFHCTGVDGIWWRAAATYVN